MAAVGDQRRAVVPSGFDPVPGLIGVTVKVDLFRIEPYGQCRQVIGVPREVSPVVGVVGDEKPLACPCPLAAFVRLDLSIMVPSSALVTAGSLPMAISGRPSLPVTSPNILSAAHSPLGSCRG